MAKKIILAGAVVLALAVAVVGYSVFRTPEAASGPIEAIPIAGATTAPGADATAATTATSAPSADTTAATAATSDATPAASAAASGLPDGALVFEIVPDESEARFLIDEVLRGNNAQVVGTTNQVAGQIAIDPSDLTASEVGVIQINARTLATDNDFRNRAIKNQILKTDEYEFITFTPATITGLPSVGAVGETYTFQIQGDLTVTGVTKPVTFDVTVTPESEQRLTGTAATTIDYHDFELSIPDSPQVDTVADQVRLELDFVAAPAA